MTAGSHGPYTPEAVALARGDGRQVAVPDEAVDLVEVDPVLGAVLGDQAQLDPLRALGVEREVGARAVIGGAQRVALTRPLTQRAAGSRTSFDLYRRTRPAARAITTSR